MGAYSDDIEYTNLRFVYRRFADLFSARPTYEVFTGSSGTITSPRYPRYYPVNRKVYYGIQVGSGRVSKPPTHRESILQRLYLLCETTRSRKISKPRDKSFG